MVWAGARAPRVRGVEPVAGVAPDFGEGGDAGREHGHAVMKRLDQRDAEAFVERGEDKCAGVAPQLDECGVGYVSAELDGIGQAQGVGEGLQGLHAIIGMPG